MFFDGNQDKVLIPGIDAGTTLGDEAAAVLAQSREKLCLAQRLESISTFAGGIAHDFNNFLTVINGYADLLTRQLDKADPLARPITEIRKAGERAASLTRQLVAFSRRQAVQTQVFNLNSVIADMSNMLSRLMGERIALTTVLDEQLRPIKADVGQMEQVVVNLVTNARDALDAGGEITLRTSNVDLNEEDVKIYAGLAAGTYVMLEVSDTGQGIDDETLEHIFEPFFTTKGEKGTGLGLATAYGIIKRLGGHISVYSKPYWGTTFKVLLPTADDSIDDTPLETREIDAALEGTETILLVEDEESVRQFTKEVLQLYGYTVIEVDSPAAAIFMFSLHRDRIKVVLTDVVLPDLSGSALTKALIKHEPSLKVLYTSGYSDDVVIHHGVLDAGTAFIRKPYTAEELVGKLRELLESD